MKIKKEGILREFTQQEIYYWAIFADDILERLFGKEKNKTKLLKIYLQAKNKFKNFTGKNRDRFLGALDYFYNWRLNHLNEDIEKTQLKEQLLKNNIKKEIKLQIKK